MKDKLKGLLVGLVLGSTLSGTVALASGSQIEVVFRELRLMFDGVEKAPAEGEGSAFIYNARTYVPLRFVSEALGKSVEWDEANQTIWIGDNPNKVVATYEGGEITKGQFEHYLKLQLFFNSSYSQYEEDAGYRDYMLRQLTVMETLYQRVDEALRAELADEAEAQIGRWEQTGAPGGFAQALASAGLTRDEVELFVIKDLAVGKVLGQDITDEALIERYEMNVAADPGAYTIASVRHILIGLQDPMSGAELRTKEEAMALAEEVRAQLADGGNFEALAKQYSDDPGSRDNGGLYADAPVSDWVPEFKAAAMELPLKEISEPVETAYGYHVIQVDSRTVQTWEQVQEALRDQLIAERLQQLMK